MARLQRQDTEGIVRVGKRDPNPLTPQFPAESILNLPHFGRVGGRLHGDVIHLRHHRSLRGAIS